MKNASQAPETSLKLRFVLKQLLIERGITQRELAKKTGIPASTISNFVSGKVPSKLEQILLLSNFFGVSIEYLLFGRVTREIIQLEGMPTETIVDGWFRLKIERLMPNRPDCHI